MNAPPDFTARAARLLSDGGDERIVIDPATGRNRYGASPRPTGGVVYASSTANDISAPAFAHVARRLATEGTPDASGYAAALDALRRRLRAAYGVGDEVAVVFAPSGTDLEYLGLALASGRAPNGVANLLLGADEVGSGCIHSAAGRFFAQTTALGRPTAPGTPVGPWASAVDLVGVPVRHDDGAALTSAEVTARLDAAIAAARTAGRHALVHVVHGSKTGLVLPALAGLDILLARHGDALTIVVDACQARITSAAVAAYLRRGATVFLTGSKFMGGPPFSGFALVPPARAAAAAALPRGFEAIFRRAEWPRSWPGTDALEPSANPGLWLRLEAAIFELEHFQALPAVEVERVVLAFHAAVRAALVERLGARRLAPYAPGLREEGDAQPVEMRTLSTLDLSRLPGAPDFDAAQRLNLALARQGVRLGQPVKCVKLPDGRWAGTLRVGLTMAQVVAFAALDEAALAARLAADMDRIAAAMQAGGQADRILDAQMV